jgi:hypothetical protein
MSLSRRQALGTMAAAGASTLIDPGAVLRMWSLWEYRWRPAAAGVYDIALSVPDPAVPQRRLDAGDYVRQVPIEEI